MPSFPSAVKPSNLFCIKAFIHQSSYSSRSVALTLPSFARRTSHSNDCSIATLFCATQLRTLSIFGLITLQRQLIILPMELFTMTKSLIYRAMIRVTGVEEENGAIDVQVLPKLVSWDESRFSHLLDWVTVWKFPHWNYLLSISAKLNASLLLLVRREWVPR